MGDRSTERPRVGEPDLSIVICNRNTRELLLDCLLSLEDPRGELDIEVIVVDNGSTDGSSDVVERAFPHVRLIRNGENRGYAEPNNQGMAIARGRYFLLLNSDTVVQPGALQRMVEFMDGTPTAGACGPRLSFPDGTLQRSCYSTPTVARFASTMLTLDQRISGAPILGNEHFAFSHEETRPVETLLGAALMVRREVVEQTGGLDEELRVHYNDFDWCLRIRASGWKNYFVHDAEVVHHSQGTIRSENRQLEIQGEMVRNLFAFYAKHCGRRSVYGIRVWMMVGYAGREITDLLRRGLGNGSADPVARGLRRGMVLAAWRGDGESFTPSGAPR